VDEYPTATRESRVHFQSHPNLLFQFSHLRQMHRRGQRILSSNVSWEVFEEGVFLFRSNTPPNSMHSSFRIEFEASSMTLKKCECIQQLRHIEFILVAFKWLRGCNLVLGRTTILLERYRGRFEINIMPWSLNLGCGRENRDLTIRLCRTASTWFICALE
jgi:hypothetical protein